jgi:hypothetical protein
MTAQSSQELLHAIRREYPWARFEVRPYRNEDDPAIECFIYVLNTPKALLREVNLRAWELALDLYGTTPVPFLLRAVSEEKTARYFTNPSTQPVVSPMAWTVSVEHLLDVVDASLLTYSSGTVTYPMLAEIEKLDLSSCLAVTEASLRDLMLGSFRTKYDSVEWVGLSESISTVCQYSFPIDRFVVRLNTQEVATRELAA